MSQEDLKYINQVTSGDVSAYSILVDKYKAKAYSLALKIAKNEHDAEEISQDAFLKAYKGLKNFKKEAAFSTWLYRIVYNTALTKIKKRKLDTTTISDSHYEIASGNVTTSMSSLVTQDQKKYLKLALDQLPEDEATLVTLFYTYEKDMNEIADITGLTHVNVRVKLSRVRKKLYGILEKLLKKELGNLV